MCCKIKFMKRICLFIASLFLSAAVYSQSADVVTEILQSEKATYGQIAYLSGVRQKLINDDASYEDAVNIMKSKGAVKKTVNADDVIPYADISYLYLQIWPKARGGFMYRLTNGAPRYAFIFLREEGYIDQHAAPTDSVSGQVALNLLSECMNAFGGYDECMDMQLTDEMSKKKARQIAKEQKAAEKRALKEQKEAEKRAEQEQKSLEKAKEKENKKPVIIEKESEPEPEQEASEEQKPADSGQFLHRDNSKKEPQENE